MAATPPNQAQPQYSADGRWWWDGQRWVPATAGGIVPTRPNRFPWGVYGLLGCGAVALLLIVAIVIGSVLSAPRATPRTATQTPSASPVAKASLTSVQVVAEGIGGRSIGAVLKNVSQNYVFAFSYKATLYDAQGAQVGIFSMFPDVNLLPGEMVSIDGGGDAAAPAARFILTLNPDHFACAYPVLKASMVPAPVPPAPAVWTASHPVDPKFPSGTQAPGEVTGTLQVPSARQGITAQGLLYDGAGHLTGTASSDKLTSADGPTPVRIVFNESFTYSGFPNPWGPVSTAMVSAYDDLQTLPSDVLGDCQQLTA
jgi:hypothetical protein